MENKIMSDLKEAQSYVKKYISEDVKTGIVLGSGFGYFAESFKDKVVIPYEEIPNFPVSTVAGHAGKLIIGKYADKPVICMCGRIHYYEGYSLEQVVFGIRLFKLLGVENVILTNASGGINEKFEPSDFMIINDHINFTGINPLIGKNLEEFGPRFPDMTYSYDPDLINIAKTVANKIGMRVHEGVYAFMTGPSFETPTEIRALKTLGADAVGMSTVPEVIVAVHCGMKVLAISCISNKAAGLTGEELKHAEVEANVANSKDKFIELIKGIIEIGV